MTSIEIQIFHMCQYESKNWTDEMEDLWNSLEDYAREFNMMSVIEL